MDQPSSLAIAPSTENKRHLVKGSHRWVIKIGSALLTNDGRGLDRKSIADLLTNRIFFRIKLSSNVN